VAEQHDGGKKLPEIFRFLGGGGMAGGEGGKKKKAKSTPTRKTIFEC